MTSNTGLYIDLLIRTLTNTIYQDPSIHFERPGPFQAAVRDVGRDWPRTAHTMVGVQRLTHLAELAVQTLADGVPGDFIETGVWRGGCCILLRGVLAAHGVTDRRVYLADSFAGLPPPNSAAFPKDDGFDLSGFTELAVSLEEVRDNFSRYGLLDDQVVFVKGWFSETLMALEAGPFALIRLDGDLYESTYVALDALYPRLSPGGFVIIDDFNAIQQCKDAVMDYRARFGIETPLRKGDWSEVWWRKE